MNQKLISSVTASIARRFLEQATATTLLFPKTSSSFKVNTLFFKHRILLLTTTQALLKPSPRKPTEAIRLPLTSVVIAVLPSCEQASPSPARFSSRQVSWTTGNGPTRTFLGASYLLLRDWTDSILFRVRRR